MSSSFARAVAVFGMNIRMGNTKAGAIIPLLHSGSWGHLTEFAGGWYRLVEMLADVWIPNNDATTTTLADGHTRLFVATFYGTGGNA